MPLPAAVPAAVCKASPAGVEVRSGSVRIWVQTIGAGAPVVFIPSFGRGVGDFDDVARRMAARGYMAVLPDPRGAGRSAGPPPASLDDLASDVRSVIESRCSGPVDVVGHAFGNRVARVLAVDAPQDVRDLALLAGGGEVAPTREVSEAVQVAAAQGEAPDARRLAALRLAFFARGHDPAVWLQGWEPGAVRAQHAAGAGAPASRWWKAGSAPVLLLQASEDPVAPPANGDQLKRDIGERLSLVRLDRASHAMLPEQPAAIAAVLAQYFAGERREAALQRTVSERVEPPRPTDGADAGRPPR